MPNREHLKILKSGLDPWDKWRANNPHIRPNLSKIKLNWNSNFRGLNLIGTDLRGADLQVADFHAANLSRADLRNAELRRSSFLVTDLVDTDLRNAKLGSTLFQRCDLQRANFAEAELGGAIFQLCNLKGADFSGAILASAIFSKNHLSPETNFTQAVLFESVFSNVDLGQVKGLDNLRHAGPCTIGTDTLYLSMGKIPEVFLRSAGLSEEMITLAKSMGPIVQDPPRYHSCFLSHSSLDRKFADRLHSELKSQGITCWYSPHALKTGDKFGDEIEKSIRAYDKLLIVLSVNSIASGWVEHEVAAAEEREKQQSGSVLFPIRLDKAIVETDQAWAARLRRTRHITDFSDWKNTESYKTTMERLLRDLTVETKAASAAK